MLSHGILYTLLRFLFIAHCVQSPGVPTPPLNAMLDVESRERSESHLVPNVSVNNIISAFCSPNESFLIEGVKTGSIFLFVH